MTEQAQVHSAQPSASFRTTLGLAAGFMAFVAWDQSHWWRVKEDYSFGWLVPLFVAYVVHDRWPQITVRLRETENAPSSPRWVRWAWNTLGGLGLLGGALLFLLGAFYRAGAGASHPGTLALTLGMVGIVLPLIFFNVPVTDGEQVGALAPKRPDRAVEGNGPYHAGRALGADGRFRVTAILLFPVLVWLISAPLVSVVEAPVSLFLLRKVVTVVAFVFDLLGLPVEQQGNVLLLPQGAVGVADACSGIRSLTACLFAGSFLGAVFFTELWKKVSLVGAAMLFAFLLNLGRSLFLTGWVYARGPEVISGPVHDLAGYAVLGLTCAGLLALVPLFNRKLAATETVAAAGPPAALER